MPQSIYEAVSSNGLLLLLLLAPRAGVIYLLRSLLFFSRCNKNLKRPSPRALISSPPLSFPPSRHRCLCSSSALQHPSFPLLSGSRMTPNSSCSPAAPVHARHPRGRVRRYGADEPSSLAHLCSFTLLQPEALLFHLHL